MRNNWLLAAPLNRFYKFTIRMWSKAAANGNYCKTVMDTRSHTQSKAKLAINHMWIWIFTQSLCIIFDSTHSTAPTNPTSTLQFSLCRFLVRVVTIWTKTFLHFVFNAIFMMWRIISPNSESNMNYYWRCIYLICLRVWFLIWTDVEMSAEPWQFGLSIDDRWNTRPRTICLE